MVFEINIEYNALILKEATKDEVFSLDKYFNRQVEGWQYKKKYANGWDGKVIFFKDYKFIPLGLRSEVKEMCKKFDYPLIIEDESNIINESINLEWFTNIVKQFLKDRDDIEIRDYQIKTAYDILKNRYCLGELATSAGKTLILFMTLLYHRAKNPDKKILIVVPSVDLVQQSIDEILFYDRENKLKFNIQPIFAGTKEIENSNVVIGTYQSLVKKDKKYYTPFNVCIVDETHKATATSIREVLKNCLHCEYRYGVSGTIQKTETTDRWNVMSYTGPIISEVKARYLMDNGYITKCKITIFNLKYRDIEIRKKLYTLSSKKEIDGKELYILERKYVAQNENRVKFIVNLCKKSKKNILILFKFRDYGEKIYQQLKKEVSDLDKKVYYIDGEVTTDNRKIFKDDIKESDNIIMVASYGTFSTGINAPNLHYLILSESIKDEKLLRQSIGRLLRKHDTKELAHVIDLQDDLSVIRKTGSIWENALLRHGRERIKVYKSEEFDYIIKNIEI